MILLMLVSGGHFMESEMETESQVDDVADRA